MRRYPLEPDEADSQRAGARRDGDRPNLVALGTYRLAAAIVWFLELRNRRRDLAQLLTAGVLVFSSVLIIIVAATTDMYLHRGVESGAMMPYVVQPSGRELATNVDFVNLSDEQMEQVATILETSGFGFVRHEIRWSEVEVLDGQYDWSVYDPIFNTLEQHGIGIIAVIVDSPRWTWGQDLQEAEYYPPADPQILERFAQELTSHYPTSVRFVQVWHQPNLATRWGGTPATGETFRPYLSAAFYGARSGNPEVQVILPEPALRSDVAGGMSDLEFLQSVYDAGSRDIFDILAIQLDGGRSSPDDRSVNENGLNISRAILFRELMVANEDSTTPIWATSFGWQADNGHVTRDEQAEYVVRGLQRAWSEWPWMGLMVQWRFTTLSGDPAVGYAIAPEGHSTPLFERLTAPELIRRSDIANTGFTPMDADSVRYDGKWANQHLEGRTFKTTSQTDASMTFEFQGTGLIAYIRTGPNSGDIDIILDGKRMIGSGEEGRWSYYYPYATDDLPRRLFVNLKDTIHVVTLTLSTPGQLTLGGMIVERQPPFTWPIIMLTITGATLLFFGMRSLIFLIAYKSGHLRRPETVNTPELPVMANWAQGRYQ